MSLSDVVADRPSKADSSSQGLVLKEFVLKEAIAKGLVIDIRIPFRIPSRGSGTVYYVEGYLLKKSLAETGLFYRAQEFVIPETDKKSKTYIDALKRALQEVNSLNASGISVYIWGTPSSEGGVVGLEKEINKYTG